MRPPPRLSGCYTPVPRYETTLEKRKEQVLSGQRGDDRRPNALRRLVLQSNAAATVSSGSGRGGSALVELGHTKVWCTVLGPVTASCSAVPSSLTPLSVEEGTLHVEVKYAPATGYPEHLIDVVRSIEPSQKATTTTTAAAPSPQQSKQWHSFLQSRESDLSTRLLTAIQAVVSLVPYPKCAILVHVTVFQDDGSVLAASVTAATLALVQAGIELYDVVAACSVAIVHGKEGANGQKAVLLADPTLDEMNMADSVVTIGILPNWKEVTLWEQWGTGTMSSGLSLTTTNEAVSLCRVGCRTMHKFIREHLIHEISNPCV
jgi:exosome complex component MTR3